MLPHTVRERNRLNCWKIIPIPSRTSRSSRSWRVVISRPSMRTLPEVVVSRALISRTRVDFPAPE